jgi:hypothetical protein
MFWVSHTAELSDVPLKELQTFIDSKWGPLALAAGLSIFFQPK